MRRLSLFLILATPFVSGHPCPSERRVLVQLKAHRLWLCDGTEEPRKFPVAIGSGGIGKQREGDGRSPVGTYPLGEPRPSAKFGTFIPVGYPTAEERRAGLTGSDIGIHGPPRSLFLLGIFSTWVDWTAGCVAVSSQKEIQEIASWVKKQPVVVQMREE